MRHGFIVGAVSLFLLAAGAGAEIIIDDFSSGTDVNQVGHTWYYQTHLGTKGGNAVAGAEAPFNQNNHLIPEWAGSTGRYTNRLYGGEDGCIKGTKPGEGLYEEITSDGISAKGYHGHPNYQMLFKPSDNALRPGGGATNAVLKFRNLKAPYDPCYPGVVMGTNLTKGPNPDLDIGIPGNPHQSPVGNDFAGVTAFTFWAKVSHSALLNNQVKFKVETADQLYFVREPSATPGMGMTGSMATSKKLADAPYYAPLRFDAVDEWQFFTVHVTGPGRGGVATIGDLRRDAWETHAQFQYEFDILDAVRIAWFVEGSSATAAVEGEMALHIDDVRTIGGVEYPQYNMARLSELSVSNGTLFPEFNRNSLFYSLTVPNSVNSLAIEAASVSAEAIIIGDGEKTLDVGVNTFEIKVTESSFTRIYRLNVIRNAMNGEGTIASPYIITEAAQLAFLADMVNTGGNASFNNSHYRLDNNIDLSNYNASNTAFNNGKGWIPVGTPTRPFRGVFDGNGKIISGLFINSAESNAGLFGVINGGTVRNLGLEDVDISGGGNAGGVAGQITGNSTITNIYTDGTVKGGTGIGGLAGVVENSSVTHSYSTCAVGTSGFDLSIDLGFGFCDWGPWNGLYGGCWPIPDVAELYNCQINGNPVSFCTGGIGGVTSGGLVGVLRDGTLSNSAALNPEVIGIGRVVGRTEGTSTLSNNLAFSDMLDANGTSVWSNKGPGLRDGEDIDGLTIHEVGTLFGRFTSPAWTTQNGKLPGFGQPREIPDYIKSGPHITSVSISPPAVLLMGGMSAAFTASVTGVNNPPSTMTWSVTGGSAGTSISPDGGVLTVAAGEPLSLLIVRATSTLDNTKFAEAGVEVVPAMAGDGTSESPYIITMWEQLVFLTINLNEGGANFSDKHYRLGNDIDISEYCEHFNDGKGWIPIGTQTRPFSGVFDGNNKIISGLYINNPTVSNMGLFGVVHNGTVKNLGVEGVNIRGNDNVGGIVGHVANFDVSPSHNIIDNCYSTGTVMGNNSVGGIVGNISRVSSGVVTFNISNSYSTAAISGSNAGGLVGNVGGNGLTVNITNCYSAGMVSGSSNVGGLVGFIDASVTVNSNSSYWDAEATGRLSSAVGTRVNTTSAMKTQSTFTNWDFPSIWTINEGQDYPRLISFLPVYTVTFVDGLGKEIAVRTVYQGFGATPPDAPVRETHNFTGWDGDYTNVTSNRTITAEWTIKTYAVTFADGFGNEITVRTVDHGADATPPSDPTRESHNFTSWSGDYTNVTSNRTITAQWAIKTYTVTFADGFDNEIIVRTVDHGTDATPPSDPVRETHNFTSWSGDYTNVTSDRTITALWALKTYTVSIAANNNDYGSVSVSSGPYEHGSEVTVTAVPFDDEHEFVNWSDAVGAVSTDAVYKFTITRDVDLTANFRNKNKIFITASVTPVGAGTVSGAGEYTIGSGVIVRAVANETYNFLNWTVGGIEVETDAVYNFTADTDAALVANFAVKTYTVTFRGPGGTVLATRTVNHGTGAAAPSNPVREGYTFTGWSTAFANVTGNMTVLAQWEINTYTVTFKNHDGTVLKTGAVAHGSGAPAPAAPIRAGYTFTGWDVSFHNVTGNLTVTAQWTANTYTYTLTFGVAGGNGTLTATVDGVPVTSGSTVQHGQSVVFMAAPNDGYEVDVWKLDGAVVSDNTTNKYEFTDFSAAAVMVEFKAGHNSVLSPDRGIPGVGIGEEAGITSANALTSEFTAGPNPVSKSSGIVNFFWQGKKMRSVSLTIFDASGNVVRKISTKDNKDAKDDTARRIVGSWDLTDAKGRQVSEGTYLVKGVITASDGKKERVSLMIGVR